MAFVSLTLTLYVTTLNELFSGQTTLFVIVVKTKSYVAQVDLELLMQLRMTLNF